MAEHQAKLAADSRSFPVFIYDPRKGSRFKERLSLVGNPNVKDDWYVHPKTGEQIDFVYFAPTEGRFAKHFDKDGNPSATLLATQQERLENWHVLQELAGKTNIDEPERRRDMIQLDDLAETTEELRRRGVVRCHEILYGPHGGREGLDVEDDFLCGNLCCPRTGRPWRHWISGLSKLAATPFGRLTRPLIIHSGVRARSRAADSLRV